MDPILVGKAITTDTSGNVHLLPKFGNRHGLIAGATGTGKTVTLMTLTEGFSRIGVPVFLADVKGDVAGLAAAGAMNEKIQQRLALMGDPDYRNEACPTVFWDLYGKRGHPVRTTVSEMGPTLLGRILELNDTQSGVLDIVFKLADDRGLLLLDLEDLRALLGLVAEERKDISTSYGLVSTQSIGAIQRALLRLEQEGAEMFFGEPALELGDLMRTTPDGRGVVNVLAADQLILKPKLYSSFLLWLLSELFETLPEVGDLDKPRLVFVFDEAHLLFEDAPPALQQRIEQVVRIIRSKGVGVYFCSQFPDDVPDDILGQLGNRFQHALRAFTPRDQKAVKATAQTMRQKPGLDIETAITELAVGEALVSLLDAKGRPTVTERVYVLPPGSQIGPITPQQRQALVQGSLVAGVYEKSIDRESAFEKLSARTASAPAAPAPAGGRSLPGKTEAAPAEGGGVLGGLSDVLFGSTGPRGGRHEGLATAMAKSAVRTMGTTVGREIIRGVLGGIFGGKKR